MYKKTLGVTDRRPFEMIYRKAMDGKYYYSTGEVSQSTYVQEIFGSYTGLYLVDEVYVRSGIFEDDKRYFVVKSKDSNRKFLSKKEWTFLKLKTLPGAILSDRP